MSAFISITPSSASDSDSASRHSASTVRKNLNPNRRRSPPPKTDQYAISADQWTPIVGGPLPKKRKKDKPKENIGTNGSTKNNLVHLFEGDVSPSKASIDSINGSQDSTMVLAEQKVSLYVECFEEMLNTVLEHENYLFDGSELTALNKWKQLPYHSRYVFVRLFMRKNSKWFRLDKLQQDYKTEVDDIKQACSGLCHPIDGIEDESSTAKPPLSKKLKDRVTETENSHKKRTKRPHKTSRELLDPDFSKSQFSDLEKEQVSNWCTAAGTLLYCLDRALALQGTEPSPISDLITAPNLPIGLPPISAPVNVSSLSNRHKKPLQPPSPSRSPPELPALTTSVGTFAIMTTENLPLINTDELWPCLNLDELKGLAKKAGVNYHTTRDVIIKSLKSAPVNQSTLCGDPAKKGKGKKQLSIGYDSKGNKKPIKPLKSRILEVTGPCIKLSAAICSLFNRLHLVFHRSSIISPKTMTASVLARFNLRNYPAYQVVRGKSLFESRQALIQYECALEREKKFEDLLATPPDEAKSNGRLDTKEEKEKKRADKEKRLREALEIFEEVWIDWRAAILEEDKAEALTRSRLAKMGYDDEQQIAEYDRLNYYKKRFRPGWPLTRIVCKGALILSRFHQYQREVDVLTALLNQNHFRRGRRGSWYDRLALVLMTHLSKSKTDQEQKEHDLELALYTCEHGLLDPCTNQIYRLGLLRRLRRLENMLSVSDSRYPNYEQKNFSHEKIIIHYPKLDCGRETGKKSMWLSEVDGSQLTVEEASLEYYTSRGWRGFHAESSILTMIFSLLFWEIIFAPVDGAFETAFQNAPLDLSTDAFSIVRAPLIQSLLEEIESGGIEVALELIRARYDKEFPRRTWCIGINWEKYGLEDILEIVECIGVKGTLMICKTFSEDWDHTVGGVPDLCLWKIGNKRCKFVEVKGPNDRLSEKQKVWMDLLSEGGIEVGQCLVKPK